MVQVVEAVPNFSEGRDPTFVEEVAHVFRTAGCEVLDEARDPDHNRSVVTVIGSPEVVATGALGAARVALERVDLRDHEGVHPRIGALDVLPFVPLHGVDMADTVRLAHRVGREIAAIGIPVFFYGHAASGKGALSHLRKGGFEALRQGARSGRREADLPGCDQEGRPVHRYVHPTAGAACVGARQVLLAWNVDIDGISLECARAVAGGIREESGGFPGVRALALKLSRQGRMQISMNLEDPSRADPMEVFRAIQGQVLRQGGRVVETEVIGMIPDALSDPEVQATIRLRDPGMERQLSSRLSAHLARAKEKDRAS